MSETILIVEDDEALGELLVEELRPRRTVHWVSTLKEARAALARHLPSLLITDLRLPDGNGIELLAELPEPRPGVVVITAFGDVSQAVDALKRGADDFLTKPLDLDHLLLSVQRVLETHSMRAALEELSHPAGFHGLYGQSPPMRELYRQIERVAQGQGAVLIQGESGTGKELVARALHAASPRSEGPFLAVNCAGIPADLLESEFFGHTAGAFTGAGRARRGLLLEAHGGSVLLDEIAEMPLSLQARLLRALQDGHIRPVGQDREERVDVRVIAATHGQLRERVDQGRFREDLYYRLETFALRVPPLRERGEDIELLAARFLYRHGQVLQRRMYGLTDAALERLRSYPFPGNVRELDNAMEYAATFTADGWVDVEHLPQRLRSTADSSAPAQVPEELLSGPLLPTLEELQRSYVRHVLEQTGGNKRRAAALLGIGRRTLYRWLARDDEGQQEEGGKYG